MIRIISETSHISMERSINALLAEHPGAKVHHLSVHPMHDMYSGCEPRVCNTWNEYLALVEIL